MYTCALAYWVGGALADFPIASIVVSGLITTILIGVVYWFDRRRRPGETKPAVRPENRQFEEHV